LGLLTHILKANLHSWVGPVVSPLALREYWRCHVAGNARTLHRRAAYNCHLVYDSLNRNR